MRALYCLPTLALLAGCATTGTAPKTPGDPYENINRKMWAFDQTLDRVAMKPVAKGYISVVPHPLRHGLSNMLSNVTEPFSFINAILQGKPKRALNTLGRFVINTTIGIGGFMDVASRNGYPQAQEDLGQTFAVWGMKKSTYLVLPLYGPTTIRDGLGNLAAEWVDPYRIVIRKKLDTVPAIGLTAFEFVDARANLIDSGADSLLENSADSYAVARSAFLQHRQAQIEDRDDNPDSNNDADLNAALDELGPDNSATPAAPAQAATPTATPAAEPSETTPAAQQPGAQEPSAPATPEPRDQTPPVPATPQGDTPQ